MIKDKKRYDISKAEAFANQIINEAELKRKKYMDRVHDVGDSFIGKYEQELKEHYAKKNYDLTKEQKNLENGKIQDIKTVVQQFEAYKEEVVEFLIDKITTVNAEINKNIIADFESLKVKN